MYIYIGEHKLKNGRRCKFKKKTTTQNTQKFYEWYIYDYIAMLNE